MRILIVEDENIVALDMRMRLEAMGYDIVGVVDTGELAVERSLALEPDLVIMDVRLPDGSGIEACREIRAEHPNVRVVMLTSYPDEEAVLSAIVAGASGYLLKQVRARDLISALEAVGRGESLLDPAVTARVLERLRTPPEEDERLASLTGQERKVLELIAEGLTNRQIGERIHLAEKTVKNYVSSILSKLNLERRAQAAAFVAKHRTPGSG